MALVKYIIYKNNTWPGFRFFLYSRENTKQYFTITCQRRIPAIGNYLEKQIIFFFVVKLQTYYFNYVLVCQCKYIRIFVLLFAGIYMSNEFLKITEEKMY